jgi:hypothetical protein
MKWNHVLAGVIAAAGATTIALELGIAPSAIAGPASHDAEVAFLLELVSDGVNIRGVQQKELQLGYLLCGLDQAGRAAPAGTDFIHSAARAHLCYAVQLPARPDPAEIAKIHQIPLDGGNHSNDTWSNTDQDHDGVTDSHDSARDNPNIGR